MYADLISCDKCGKYFLAQVHHAETVRCPHCNETTCGIHAEIDIDNIAKHDVMWIDTDAGCVLTETDYLTTYTTMVKTYGDLHDVSFNKWMGEKENGLYILKLNMEKVREDVFPYLAEIVETYCPDTDQTYLLGRYMDWYNIDNEEIKLLNWYYGKPNDNLSIDYLGYYLDLAIDYIEWKEN